MNNRKSSRRLLCLCLVAGLVCHARTAGAGLRESLSKALGDFCIPGDAATCSNANYSLSAYTPVGAPGANKCKCPCEDMAYNAVSRKCEVCEDGVDNGQYSTECRKVVCAAGYYSSPMTDTCPAGYYKWQQLEWSCDYGFGPASCSAGYYKAKK